MASQETLQLMICLLWTVPSILVRKNISIYDYFQTCLLKNLPKKSAFHFNKYSKMPSIDYSQIY